MWFRIRAGCLTQSTCTLVDRYGCLLIEALGLIMPVGSHGPERGFNCTCVVAAEEQLTTGGLEYNADIRLGSATIAPVSGVQCAVCNCCCHVGLLSSSVHPYNQHSIQIHGKDGSLSLSAYHMCITQPCRSSDAGSGNPCLKAAAASLVWAVFALSYQRSTAGKHPELYPRRSTPPRGTEF